MMSTYLLRIAGGKQDVPNALKRFRVGFLGKAKNDRMELFKNFLVAVYVYDDNRMKLVFSCMGDQNSVEIPLETGEDPPDGGLSLDAKMFVLTPDSSTKKALYFVGSMVLFFLLMPLQPLIF